MSTVTVPTYPQNRIEYGDLDIFVSETGSGGGDGTIFIRNGHLYVEGITDLDETTINTTDGQFTVTGSNKVSVDVSAAIELAAASTSFLTTSSGTLSVSATDSTTGKVTLLANGSGTDSILINAANVTDGQVTISSAGASTSINAIRLLATDTSDGDIYIKGSGNYTGTNPAVFLEASNAVSGQIKLLSAGDSSTVDGILLTATGSTDGNILIKAAGTNTNVAGVKIEATNAVSGQILLTSAGAIASAIKIVASDATSGGVSVNAGGGIVSIDTLNTATGVTIATATSGVPVTIGTTNSVTTINGHFVVKGATTSFRSEEVTIEDNLVLLNSGNGELGLDSGIVVRRYQTPNGTGAGDVVTSPNPVQESGAFKAGSATPGTLVLSEFASATADFYSGWWIKITSGTGINQVRRIKTYDETTKTATIYVTADNTTPANGPPFNDGLNLVTAPAAADTYRLYNGSHVATYYNETLDAWEMATSSNVPDAVSVGGTSNLTLQQYQKINTGAVDIYPLVFRNVFASASGTTITFTLIGHSASIGDKVYVSDAFDFTPTLATGQYVIQTTPTANTFTITAPASTTTASDSSATLSMQNTSKISVNVISPHDNGFGFSIGGFLYEEYITILKTSTAYNNITTSALFGVYLVAISDSINTNGAYALFTASSGGSGGNTSRISNAAGANGQMLDLRFSSGNLIQFRQFPPHLLGSGTYTYKIKILKMN